MQTYITVLVITVSLFVMMISMWGIGDAEAKGNKDANNAAAVFYVVGLLSFCIGMFLGIQMPEIELCTR